jgi:hypothetical protein
VCRIILFRVVIILFVTVGVVLVVDICYTNVVSVVPICTSPGVGVWASNIIISADINPRDIVDKSSVEYAFICTCPSNS